MKEGQLNLLSEEPERDPKDEGDEPFDMHAAAVAAGTTVSKMLAEGAHPNPYGDRVSEAQQDLGGVPIAADQREGPSASRLIHDDDSWKLAPGEIEAGRAGIASARAALADASRSESSPQPNPDDEQ